MTHAYRYGFIGLGQIGAPMAERVAGPDLIVYDVRAEAMEPLAAKGARTAERVADVASAAVVSVMVRDDAQVDQVAGELLPAAAPGTVLAVHSTIRAGTAAALAERAKPYGVEVVDAPVSGGFMGAAQGTLAAMVGGTDTAFAQVKDVFSGWASLVLHVGPVGAGTRTKLARNLLHFVAFAAVGEAQRLAEAAGVPLAELGRVVRHSDAVTGGPGAIMLRDTTAPLAPDDPLYEIMRGAHALGEKDLSHALALADELGVDAPLARLARARLAAAFGLPEEDPS